MNYFNRFDVTVKLGLVHEPNTEKSAEMRFSSAYPEDLNVIQSFAELWEKGAKQRGSGAIDVSMTLHRAWYEDEDSAAKEDVPPAAPAAREKPATKRRQSKKAAENAAKADTAAPVEQPQETPAAESPVTESGEEESESEDSAKPFDPDPGGLTKTKEAPEVPAREPESEPVDSNDAAAEESPSEVSDEEAEAVEEDTDVSAEETETESSLPGPDESTESEADAPVEEMDVEESIQDPDEATEESESESRMSEEAEAEESASASEPSNNEYAEDDGTFEAYVEEIHEPEDDVKPEDQPEQEIINDGPFAKAWEELKKSGCSKSDVWKFSCDLVPADGSSLVKGERRLLSAVCSYILNDPRIRSEADMTPAKVKRILKMSMEDMEDFFAPENVSDFQSDALEAFESFKTLPFDLEAREQCRQSLLNRVK